MTTWEIDRSHSSVTFSVRHMVIAKASGRFHKFSGKIETSKDDFSDARVTAEIDAASIDTGEAQRDGHLRSPDFFAVEQHPTLKFEGSRVENKGGNNHVLHGQLTIRGTTKPVALEVEFHGKGKDPWGGERAGFSAKTSIDRKEFGLTWNQALETGGLLVSDKVEIVLDVEAVKKS